MTGEPALRSTFAALSTSSPLSFLWRPKNASMVNISTAVSHMPYVPSGSGYAISKMAGNESLYYVAHEYPRFFVLSLHPGIIETAMDAKTVAAGINFPHNNKRARIPLNNGNESDANEGTVNLPADFVVWAVGSDAKFLWGKVVWSNWDVD